MSVTLPYPTLGPGVVDNAKIESNFSTLANKFGNIDNSDVKSAAGISVDKHSASYEYLPITVKLVDGTAANDVVVPVYNDSKGNWTVVAIQWMTLDTGAPSGVFKVEWGLYDGTADDVIANQWTLVSLIDTVAIAGAANVSTQGVDTSPATTSLAFGGAGVYRALRVYMSTVDATAGDPIDITIQLKRQIAT